MSSFKQFLVEMPTKIAEFQPSKGRKFSVQIRTNGIMSGQSEHYPAHFHVVNFNAKLDVPIEIATGKPLSEKHKIQGKLSKEEWKEIEWFISYYGKRELIELFNRAMKGDDPSILFDKLKILKNNEHRNSNN